MSLAEKKRRFPPAFVAPLAPDNAPVRRCPVSRERASHRVLIMRVGAFGDILMGTPLLAALRDAWPDAHLTWVVEHVQVQAIDANPYIDEIIVWDGSYWKGMVRRGLYPLWLIRALQFRRTLRERHYDVFISFQPEEWPLLTLGVGAPLSVGVFDTFRRYYRAKRTSWRTRFYTHPYAHHDLPPHRIDQYLLPLKALNLPAPSDRAMSMGYTPQDRTEAARLLEEQGLLPGQTYVVLVPNTTWPSKCWPAERFAQLGDKLGERHGCRVVLIGSAKEREAVAKVASQMRSRPVTVAGDLTFRQAAALLAGAALVVSGDTGPMHVVAAVGTPYVALFGPTSPDWYGPQTAHGRHLAHAVPCGPCDQKFCPNKGDDYLRCQKLIRVPEVLAAAAELLPGGDLGSQSGDRKSVCG